MEYKVVCIRCHDGWQYNDMEKLEELCNDRWIIDNTQHTDNIIVYVLHRIIIHDDDYDLPF